MSDKIVNTDSNIFVENKPLYIYTYDDCIIGEEDYLKKPLTKIYKDFPKFNEKNTFILKGSFIFFPKTIKWFPCGSKSLK